MSLVIRVIKWVIIIACTLTGLVFGLFLLDWFPSIEKSGMDWLALLLSTCTGAGAGIIIAIIIGRFAIIKQQNIENIPLCASDFINLIIKNMRYRRNVRADVTAELAAHFEDELKDCKTDEEKEQKTQQLIAAFGDVKLLAVLMRRAKKRCRPLWRTVVARTLQIAGVLILCLIAYIAWFLSGKPIITVDYVAELNRIVYPAADENLNAAPLYDEAAKLCEKLPDDISELLGTKYEDATTEQKQLINKWLVNNKDTFELINEGTKKPFYWRKYSNEKEEYGLMAILLPHLAEFRKLAFSLRWRALLSAEQGRYQDAFDDIKACYRYGQHLLGNKTLIEQLVGTAIETIAVKTIHDIIAKYQINSAILAALQQNLEQVIASEDFSMSLKIEKLMIYDEIQRCFTEDRFGGGHLYPKRISELMSCTSPEEYFRPSTSNILHVLFTHPNKRQTRDMTDRLFSYYGNIAHKSPTQIRNEGIDVKKETMKMAKGNVLLEMSIPAYINLLELGPRKKIDLEATLATIAILRYKQDTGNYPDGLDELITANYLKELPIDPYSDKALRYEKTEDGFIIYSVGPNFTDDGGKIVRDEQGRLKTWPEDGDKIFWPLPKSQVKQQ